MLEEILFQKQSDKYLNLEAPIFQMNTLTNWAIGVPNNTIPSSAFNLRKEAVVLY